MSDGKYMPPNQKFNDGPGGPFGEGHSPDRDQYALADPHVSAENMTPEMKTMKYLKDNDEGPHGEQTSNFHGSDGEGGDVHSAPPMELPAASKTETPPQVAGPEPSAVDPSQKQAPSIAEMQKMVGGGPTADDMPAEVPNSNRDPTVDFMEANTRKMMETNTDYQVPTNAFSSLWKDFLTSTQSQLGSRDPSANSRGGIERVMPIQFGQASKKSETHKGSKKSKKKSEKKHEKKEKKKTLKRVRKSAAE